ncbi:MAG: hypothetical protein U0289_00035 [Cyclobacteriaceae bacterium]|jgi:hypothetical protein
MININNPLLANVRGQLGGICVFRQVNGQTIISIMPRKRDRSLETDAQRATYERMRTASRYAKEVLLDPGWALQYRAMAKNRKLPNAYTAAVTDYLRNGDLRTKRPLVSPAE